MSVGKAKKVRPGGKGSVQLPPPSLPPAPWVAQQQASRRQRAQRSTDLPSRKPRSSVRINSSARGSQPAPPPGLKDVPPPAVLPGRSLRKTARARLKVERSIVS